MSTPTNSSKNNTGNQPLKHRSRAPRPLTHGAAVGALLAAGCWAWAQSVPTPGLKITPIGSGQMMVTITNGVGTAYYDLYWTPALSDPANPWQAAVIGTQGQTNFTVNMGIWQSQFFRVVAETNGIPIWQAADPNNPSAGILSVFIDNPLNGAVLQ